MTIISSYSSACIHDEQENVGGARHSLRHVSCVTRVTCHTRHMSYASRVIRVTRHSSTWGYHLSLRKRARQKRSAVEGQREQTASIISKQQASSANSKHHQQTASIISKCVGVTCGNACVYVWEHMCMCVVHVQQRERCKKEMEGGGGGWRLVARFSAHRRPVVGAFEPVECWLGVCGCNIRGLRL